MDKGESETAFMDIPTELLFEAEEYISSEDPPWEEWSSIGEKVQEANQKRILYKEGLYKPGSGELCAKYIPDRSSSIYKHPYSLYPSEPDPGIMEALLNPEPLIVFPPDGRKLYLSLCEEMAQHPVRLFYKGLLEDAIDLRYYSVSSLNVRAMAKALNINSYVRYLNLTESFLNQDACLHLGEMLETNVTLYELDLEGCQIGPEGLCRLLARITSNKTLKVLNLKGNKLRDDGMQYLAEAVINGFPVVNINVSRNDISGTGAAILGNAFETYNDFMHIDLSWNNLQTLGTSSFLTRLSNNTVLEDLDLSWNFLSDKVIGEALGKILSHCTALKTLILHNNRLSGIAIRYMCYKLPKALNLVTLNLSYNPLSCVDAVKVLKRLKQPEMQVRKLLMDNVVINDEGMDTLKEVQALDYRRNTVITYGSFQGKFKPTGQDPRRLVLNRIDYVLLRAPRNKKDIKIDFAQFILQLHKEKYHVISLRDLPHIMKLRHVSLDNDLIDAVATLFPGPPEDYVKTIHIDLLVEYMSRIWPDRKLSNVQNMEPEKKISRHRRKGKKK